MNNEIKLKILASLVYWSCHCGHKEMQIPENIQYGTIFICLKFKTDMLRCAVFLAAVLISFSFPSNHVTVWPFVLQ